MRPPLHASLALALALASGPSAGCASGAASRQDVDALRAEVRSLRAENEALSRRVDTLGAAVEALAARSRSAETPSPKVSSSSPAAPGGSAAAETLAVPPDLAVVKVVPPAAAAGKRKAPPVSTAIPIAEPDTERLSALGHKGERNLAAAAESELRAARAEDGMDRAHALEDFATRYPRHPSADNALVEAASAYADAGRDEAACGLARRAVDGYPAGDAMSDALERLAWCESRRGATDLERRLLERLVSEYPRTAAARRAGPRLVVLGGGSSPEPAPATGRSTP